MSRIRPSNDTYIAEEETKQSSEIVEWKSFRSKIFRAEILIEVAALDATLGETKKIRSTREGRSTYTLYAYIRSRATNTEYLHLPIITWLGIRLAG